MIRRLFLSFLMSLPLVLGAQNLSMEECKQMALSSSMSSKNADLDVQIAQQRQKQALWAYFPSVSITGIGFAALNPLLEVEIEDVIGTSDLTMNIRDDYRTLCSQYGIDPVFSALQKGYGATVGFTQPLFVGGKIVNSNRLAAVGYEAALLQEKASARDVENEVEKQYMQIVILEEKMRSVEAGLVFLDRLYENVSAFVDGGLTLSADLRKVEQSRSALKNDANKLKSGILLSKMSLCNLIGKEYVVLPAMASDEKPYVGDICLSYSLEELQEPEHYYYDESELLTRMTEVQLLGLSARAAELEKKIALSDALPQIAVGGSYGYGNMLFEAAGNGLLYAVVKIPISDWGRVSHKVKEQDFKLQQAQNRQDYLSNQLLLKARKLWVDASTAWDAIAVAEYSRDTAKDLLTQAEIDYSAGLCTLSDVLQCETGLQTAENDLIEARIAYQLAIHEYLSLL